MCGYLACSRSVCRPLLDALPRVLRIPVGDGPVDIVITPDDSVAFVANFEGNSISVIDLAVNLVQTAPVDGAPRALMYVQ